MSPDTGRGVFDAPERDISMKVSLLGLALAAAACATSPSPGAVLDSTTVTEAGDATTTIQDRSDVLDFGAIEGEWQGEIGPEGDPPVYRLSLDFEEQAKRMSRVADFRVTTPQATCTGRMSAMRADPPEYQLAQNVTGGDEECSSDWFQGTVRLLHDAGSDQLLYRWQGPQMAWSGEFSRVEE